jgi:hypothetical protein
MRRLLHAENFEDDERKTAEKQGALQKGAERWKRWSVLAAGCECAFHLPPNPWLHSQGAHTKEKTRPAGLHSQELSWKVSSECICFHASVICLPSARFIHYTY